MIPIQILRTHIYIYIYIYLLFHILPIIP